MHYRFQFTPAIAEGTLPPALTVMGKQIPVVGFKNGEVLLDIPDEQLAPQVLMFLTMMTGTIVENKGEDKGCKPFEYTDESIHREMERLVDREVRMLQLAQQIPEPQISIVGHNINLDAWVPLGVRIWDSIMLKPRPVHSLSQWLKSSESDGFVYLPNDLSLSSEEAEQRINNAFYTEVMVNAYRKLCISKKINPEISLANSDVRIYGQEVCPFMGMQSTVQGEVASRLVNSKLVNFDDSKYAQAYLECIMDLQPYEYEKAKVLNYVLGRVEHILMGRTSHKSNQKIVHALYEALIGSEIAIGWGPDNQKFVVEASLGILKQMAIDGLVLEDAKDAFLQRAANMQLLTYITDLNLIYSQVLNT